MSRNPTLMLILLSLVQGCVCDENLHKICPAPRPCTILPDGGIKIYEDPESIDPKNSMGECELGHTECDEDFLDICVGSITEENEECDGLDNDCNGLIDDGLSVDFDRDGYNSAESCLRPIDCDDVNSSIYPNATENCDGLDNNCNGEIDEVGPYECWTGSEDAVLDGIAPCRTGIVSCIGGSWTGCEGQILPSPELCDNIDNDCNGEIDNDAYFVGTICGPEVTMGQCGYGSNVCVDGELLCLGADYPQNEVCDNVDNDCDGVIDNDLERLCETDCGYGAEYCSYGVWQACSAPQPAVEYCDGIDNDCDGETDENCPCISGDAQECHEDLMMDQYTGAWMSCGTGIQVCDTFGVWGECFWFGPTEEVCNDWDDDCDNIIDGMSAACGIQPQETLGVGECKAGVATCTAGEWGECVGEISPTEEVCDDLDNDCDGEIDEDLNIHDKVDMVFVIDISGSMTQYIYALAEGISNYMADFEDTEHRFALVSFPDYPDGMGGTGDPYTVETAPPLVDVTVFLSALTSIINAQGGGHEPSIDVMFELVSPEDPVGIGWREDAHPYIIMITDEQAQSWSSLQSSSVYINAFNCQIGSCEPGDIIETFVISRAEFFFGFHEMVFGDVGRYYEISPANGGRYTEMLRDIFTNICLTNNSDGGVESSN